MTLRDPKISETLNRHFIAFAVDANQAPPELRLLFDKTGGRNVPILVYTNERGVYYHGTSGGRTVDQLKEDLGKVLQNKGLAVPKARETELQKHVDALDRALQDKKYKQANDALAAIDKIRGYSELKDRAYDLLDKAQEAGAAKLKEAVELAQKEDYPKAREQIEAAAKELAGLPLGEECKGHLTAVKLLETAHQASLDRKGNWKAKALQSFDQLLRQYTDTPYARLAMVRRIDLLKD